jgi:hypothetical protein
MIFYLLVGMCLGYEIHKFLDFNTFSRLTYTIVKYSDQLKNRSVNNEIFKSILKMSITNLIYFIIVVFGMFSSQSWFFITLMIMSIISGFLLKRINKKYVKILFIIDVIVSIVILSVILINHFFSIWKV